MHQLSIIDKINGGFDIHRHFVFCVRENTFSVYLITGQLLYEYSRNQSFNLCVFGDNVTTQDVENQKQIVFSCDDFRITKQLDYIIDISYVNKNSVCTPTHICPIVEEKGNAARGYIKIPNFELVASYPLSHGLNGVGKLLKGHRFLSRKGNFLTCHALQTGKEHWRINFTALLNSQSISLYSEIFEYEHKVFFYLSDVRLGISATFCVCLETGAVLQKMDDFGGWLQFVAGKFYVLTRKELKILNPNTFEKRVLNFSTILEAHNWIFVWNKYIISNNRLYFVNENVGGSGKAVVGIIDITSQKLLWHTHIQIETGKFWIAQMRVHENRLYVLTQGGTLYVYQ